jgi:hypothetical protein
MYKVRTLPGLGEVLTRTRLVSRGESVFSMKIYTFNDQRVSGVDTMRVPPHGGVCS